MYLISTWLFAYIALPRFYTLPRGAWVLIGPILLFLFYWIAWLRIGPDPEPGALVTRYEPPEGLSAAAARYVAHGTTDGRSFAAVIAQLAVSGCIRVEPVDGKYRLSRLMCGRAAVDALAPEERRVLGLLFEDGPVNVISPSMEQRNAAQLGRYVFHIHEELAKRFHGKYFTRHSGIVALGIFATFMVALSLAATSPTSRGMDGLGAVFLTTWILFCGLIIGMLFEVSFIPAVKSAVRTGLGGLKLLPGAAAVAVFACVIVFMMTKLGPSPYLAPTLAGFLLVNIGWAPMLKRRSALGRQVADEISGFRQFLEKVDRDELDRLDPNEQLPSKQNEYLPFAIALEVKAAWGDHLAQAFFASTVMVED